MSLSKWELNSFKHGAYYIFEQNWILNRLRFHCSKNWCDVLSSPFKNDSLLWRTPYTVVFQLKTANKNVDSISVDSRKCIKNKTMTEDSAGTCVSSMHIELNVTACKFIPFDCYNVERWKRIKTVVWTQIYQWICDDDENTKFCSLYCGQCLTVWYHPNI